MMNTETQIEQLIQEKGLNAPRLTPESIDKVIHDIKYHVIPGTTTTVCALVLRNGYVVIGSSAAASKENFDKEIGCRVAFENAREQIWALEGYLLKEKLS